VGIAEPGRLSQRRAETKPARAHPLGQQLAQPGFVKGSLAARQDAHASRVGVHTENLMADTGHAGGVHRAQVPGANDGNAQESPLWDGWIFACCDSPSR
jgi:hypothetical protein